MRYPPLRYYLERVLRDMGGYLALGRQAPSPGNSSIVKGAGNRRKQQIFAETEDFRRKPRETSDWGLTLGPSPLARSYSCMTLVLCWFGVWRNSHRPLTPILSKSIERHLPFLSRTTTFAKACPPFGRKSCLHHQVVPPYGSHLYCNTFFFAEVFGSVAVGTPPSLAPS